MHQSKPIIGITFSGHVRDESSEARTIADTYVQAVAAHGAEVRELTPGGPPVAVAELDGLLLAGGVDVAPARYGQPRHDRLGKVDEKRDELEITVTQQALAMGMPIFGICRGAQVIGVALGGTLHQDISSCIPEAGPHATEGENRVRHGVRIIIGSRLHRIVGREVIEVNSYHHQANAVVGGGLRISAVADDGIVEAVEGTTEQFLLGVQWHPERMQEEEIQRRLFAALVEAAQAYRHTRS